MGQHVGCLMVRRGRTFWRALLEGRDNREITSGARKLGGAKIHRALQTALKVCILKWWKSCQTLKWHHRSAYSVSTASPQVSNDHKCHDGLGSTWPEIVCPRETFSRWTWFLCVPVSYIHLIDCYVPTTSVSHLFIKLTFLETFLWSIACLALMTWCIMYVKIIQCLILLILKILHSSFSW